jgi:hypothetical protein
MNWKEIEKIQFVWWWQCPTFKWWHYPRTWKKPMFWGLYLGIAEIRIFIKGCHQ